MKLLRQLGFIVAHRESDIQTDRYTGCVCGRQQSCHSRQTDGVLGAAQIGAHSRPVSLLFYRSPPGVSR